MNSTSRIIKDKLSRATIHFNRDGKSVTVDYIRIDEYPDTLDLWRESGEGWSFIKANINYIEWKDIPPEDTVSRR